MLKCKNIIVIILIFICLFGISIPTTADNNSKQNICFVSNRFGNWDLFLINEDGTDLRRLTTSKLNETTPIWSPDGMKILFISEEGNFFNMVYNLWVINKDGSKLMKIAEDITTWDGQEPKWSPDSKKVVYVTEKKIIKLYDLNTKNTIELHKANIEGKYPVWSPDGHNILAYFDGDDPGIYILNSSGKDKLRLIKDKGSYQKLSWAPDGSKFAYIHSKPLFGRKSGIYIADKEGNKIKYLGKGDEISWSSDNKSIAYIDKRRNNYDKNDDKTYYKLYLVNAELNNKKNKSQKIYDNTNYNPYPLWSPDGMKLAYKSKSIVYVKESGSNELIKIDVPSSNYQFDWSPDSKKILLFGKPNFFTSISDLFIVNYKNGQIYNITNTEDVVEITPVWSPIP